MFLIKPPPSTSKTETGDPSLAPDTTVYEAAVIANLHVPGTGVRTSVRSSRSYWTLRPRITPIGVTT
jgi:hypothetical protein